MIIIIKSLFPESNILSKTAYLQYGLHKSVLTYKCEGDTPLFGTQYSGGDLEGTQYAKGRYAKGRYAVRRISVISYADINFYFKKVQFS